MSLNLPPDFVQRVSETWDEGAAWIAALPDTIARYARHWNLRVQPAFTGLSYNYVAPASMADDTPVVLKLGVPNPELSTEADALRLWDGDGGIRLIDADADGGALLIERVQPGVKLVELSIADDERATLVAAEVMQRIWRPVPEQHRFPSLERWFSAVGAARERFGSAGPIPARTFDRGERLMHALLAAQGEPVVLHGDLHHFNILTAERAPWLAIDPKGIVGDRGYELGPLMINPNTHLMRYPNPRRTIARRVAVLAEALGFDRERVLAWAMAHALLSMCWDSEGGGTVDAHSLAYADLLIEMT